MAHWTGVEPVTYRLEIGCSIQLSYRCGLSGYNKAIDSKGFKIQSI